MSKSFFQNDDREFQRAAIEAALDYIEPSALSRDEWLRVLMALHSADMPIILAEEWSARDIGRYHKGEAERIMRGFDRGSSTGKQVTAGTIFKMAKDLGGFDVKEYWREYHKFDRIKKSTLKGKRVSTDTDTDATVAATLTEQEPTPESMANAINSKADYMIALFKANDAKRAGEVALEIINGVSTADIKPEIFSDNNDLICALAVGEELGATDIDINNIVSGFRLKCKQAKIKLSGKDGIDPKIAIFKSKIQEAKFYLAEKQRQKELDASIRRNLRSEIDWILPIDKVLLPSGMIIDAASKTIRDDSATKFNCIMFVTKILKNFDDTKEKVEIAVLNATSNDWTTFTTEHAIIGSKTKIVELKNHGLDVDSNNASQVIQYFKDFEFLNKHIIKTVRTVNSTGWRDKSLDFVFPNTEDSPFQLDDSVKPILDRVFTSRGNRVLYNNMLHKIKRNDTANIVLGGVLSAPLVKHFRCPNIALHVYANTGSGKSTLNKAVFALYGNPVAPGAIPTANATKVGLEFFFAGRHDLPAIVEDIDSVSDERSKRVMRDLPYQFVNQMGRLRGKPKGGNDKLLDFRGTLITNGERPLTTDTSSGGGKRRLIELKGEDKIFDDDFAREITFTVEDNYGLLGREWVEFIKNNLDEMKENYIDVTRGIPEGIEGKVPMESFFVRFKGKVPLHISTMSAIFIANLFFDVHFLGMKDQEAWNFEIHCLERVFETLPDEIEIADYMRAIEYIRDWIESHPKNFSTQMKDAEGFETWGIIKSDVIAIYPTIFKDFLNSKGFNAEMITKKLTDIDVIARGSKGHVAKLIKIEGTPKRMIVIDREKLEMA